jgi:hypothetical protein
MNNKLKIMWKTAQIKACCRSLHGNVETSGAVLRKPENTLTFTFTNSVFRPTAL